MISPVSFGSTYKISAKSSDDVKQQLGYNRLSKFCEENKLPYQETFSYSAIKPFGTPKYNATTTIVALNCDDNNIENFCAANGIKFHKINSGSLMQPEAIESRIADAPEGYRLAKINHAKLSELLKTQGNNNFQHCESDYNKFYRDQLDFMLKSEEEIPAATLYITPWSSKEDALDYISKWGSENLNDNSVNIDLSQRTNAPDHCMYFAMKDAGMTSIPVYVDNDTYELGQAMGLIE